MPENNLYVVKIELADGHTHVFCCDDEHFDELMLHLLENPSPLDTSQASFVVSLFCQEKANSDGFTPPSGCY